MLLALLYAHTAFFSLLPLKDYVFLPALFSFLPLLLLL